MKKTILIICFLFISAITFAQRNYWAAQTNNVDGITFGLMGGSNFAFFQAKLPDGVSESSKAIQPISLGINADIRINQGFSVRPGLFYSGKGGDLVYIETFPTPVGDISESVDQTFKLNYIEVPITFIGHIPVSDGFNLLLGAGPYAAMALSGTANTTVTGVGSEKDKLTFGKGGEFKKVDFGATGLLGVETDSGIIVGLNYDMGLANVLQPSSTGANIESLKNGAIYVSVGFRF